MKYISTRGKSKELEFDEVLLAGLAEDGGLYLPKVWPEFSLDEIKAMRDLSYEELAVRVISPFVENSLTKKELEKIVDLAYANFDHPAIAPIKQVGERLFVMELIYGPTLAFKDYALQLVGQLFDHVLTKKNKRITIVGATSGDTGSAAIEACRDRENLDIFILHPKDRVSDVQRRQMTTVKSSNVFNIALEGNFDDCQNMVKALFADENTRQELQLSAVNSINWARIMAQIVYYFRAALLLGAPDRPVNFAVPTGNFGNIFAGFAAKKMGLPINRLIVGSNRNDILPRFFATGRMKTADVKPTTSPSMDIQISSNFERLLFELYDRDASIVKKMMSDFKKKGEFSVDEEHLQKAGQLFSAIRFDDEQVSDIIDKAYQYTGMVLDPHSAIGVEAARIKGLGDDGPFVSLATAHPAKFPDAVEKACGVRPKLPDNLSDLFQRDEKMVIKPDDISSIKDYIRSKSRIIKKEG